MARLAPTMAGFFRGVGPNLKLPAIMRKHDDIPDLEEPATDVEDDMPDIPNERTRDDYNIISCDVGIVPIHLLEVIELPVTNGDDGLTLDITSIGLAIVEIGEDAVKDHNLAMGPNLSVRVNDIITGVNGEADPTRMLTIMQSEQKFRLDIVHPRISIVTFLKASGNLGLNLRYTPGSKCIEVLEISEGDVQAYNETVCSAKRVSPGCLISAVNGVSGSVRTMLAQLKVKQSVQLTLLHVVVDKEITYVL